MPDITGFNSALSSQQSQPLDYGTWAAQNGHSDLTNPYGVGAKIWDWFTGDYSRAQDEYNLYLAQRDKDWELAKINDARRWEEYMSNTAFSRQMKDIENAGYNPLLALTGGAGNGAATFSSPSGSSVSSYSGFRKGVNHPDQGGDMKNLLSTALQLAGFALMASGKVAAAGISAASREGIAASNIASREGIAAKNRAQADSHFKTRHIQRAYEFSHRNRDYGETSWFADGYHYRQRKYF